MHAHVQIDQKDLVTKVHYQTLRKCEKKRVDVFMQVSVCFADDSSLCYVHAFNHCCTHATTSLPVHTRRGVHEYPLTWLAVRAPVQLYSRNRQCVVSKVSLII